MKRLLELTSFVLSAFITAIFALALIFIPFDVYDFLTDPSDYIRVYHLNPEAENWQWAYLKGPFWLFFIGSGIISFFIYSFRHNANPRIRLMRHLIVLAVLGFVVYGFYEWYLNGFDH